MMTYFTFSTHKSLKTNFKTATSNHKLNKTANNWLSINFAIISKLFTDIAYDSVPKMLLKSFGQIVISSQIPPILQPEMKRYICISATLIQPAKMNVH